MIGSITFTYCNLEIEQDLLVGYLALKIYIYTHTKLFMTFTSLIKREDTLLEQMNYLMCNLVNLTPWLIAFLTKHDSKINHITSFIF